MSLFGMFATPAANTAPDLLHPVGKVKSYDPRQLLDWEKELIGVYLSEHPLERRLVPQGHLGQGTRYLVNTAAYFESCSARKPWATSAGAEAATTVITSRARSSNAALRGRLRMDAHYREAAFDCGHGCAGPGS